MEHIAQALAEADCTVETISLSPELSQQTTELDSSGTTDLVALMNAISEPASADAWTPADKGTLRKAVSNMETPVAEIGPALRNYILQRFEAGGRSTRIASVFRSLKYRLHHGRPAADTIKLEKLANQALHRPERNDDWNARVMLSLGVTLCADEYVEAIKKTRIAIEQADRLGLAVAKAAEALQYKQLDFVIRRLRKSHFDWLLEAACSAADIPLHEYPDTASQRQALIIHAREDADAQFDLQSEMVHSFAPGLAPKTRNCAAIPVRWNILAPYYIADLIPGDPWSPLSASALVFAKDDYISQEATSAGASDTQIVRCVHPALEHSNDSPQRNRPYILVSVAPNLFDSSNFRITPNVESLDGYLTYLRTFCERKRDSFDIVLSIHPRARNDKALLRKLADVGEVCDAPIVTLIGDASLLLSYVGSSVNLDAKRAGTPVLAIQLYERDARYEPILEETMKADRFELVGSLEDALRRTDEWLRDTEDGTPQGGEPAPPSFVESLRNFRKSLA